MSFIISRWAPAKQFGTWASADKVELWLFSQRWANMIFFWDHKNPDDPSVSPVH